MVKLKLNVLTIFSLLLIVAAVVFYILWGIYYEGWNMFAKEYIGVYAITMVLLLFGIFGLLLVKKKEEQSSSKK
ncbi:MAG: hypothetical protein HPY73_06175 [Methanomassiliicoccales archaeon]|nr:MAG: hypothetical protein HPY73_06175 [Methanomassiliicoccales archaeon]